MRPRLSSTIRIDPAMLMLVVVTVYGFYHHDGKTTQLGRMQLLHTTHQVASRRLRSNYCNRTESSVHIVSVSCNFLIAVAFQYSPCLIKRPWPMKDIHQHEQGSKADSSVCCKALRALPSTSRFDIKDISRLQHISRSVYPAWSCSRRRRLLDRRV